MNNRFIRTEMLLSEAAVKKLEKSKVLIFGIGGVGGFVCEALARSGVGNFVLVDNDTVSVSNINRQIIATEKTIGQEKTKAMEERILSINPNANVHTKNTFYLPETDCFFENLGVDYIVDAIDTVSGKIQLVLDANRLNIPIMSSMGTGNKLNPTELKVADIYKTSVCPLAKVMRKELKTRGVKKLKVVYSEELPKSCFLTEEELRETGEKTNKRKTPGSVSFVPSVAGLIIASEVIKDLIREDV